MKREIDTTPEFVVCTKNPDPDLTPLSVYEIERGSFQSMAEAEKFARELFEGQRVDAVQIFERKWVQWTNPKRWYSAEHAKSELRRA